VSSSQRGDVTDAKKMLTTADAASSRNHDRYFADIYEARKLAIANARCRSHKLLSSSSLKLMSTFYSRGYVTCNHTVSDVVRSTSSSTPSMSDCSTEQELVSLTHLSSTEPSSESPNSSSTDFSSRSSVSEPSQTSSTTRPQSLSSRTPSLSKLSSYDQKWDDGVKRMQRALHNNTDDYMTGWKIK
jgi:hypothetical protein